MVMKWISWSRVLKAEGQPLSTLPSDVEGYPVGTFSLTYFSFTANDKPQFEVSSLRLEVKRFLAI